MNNTSVSIIVPVYNSASCIEELCDRIIKVLAEIEFSDSELIFVDDNSNDKSFSVLKKLKEKYPNSITIIKLSRNFGQHNATLCGIKHAKYNYVVTIDDDLEFQPEDIIKLFEKQKQGDFDIVYGVDSEKNYNFILRLLFKFYKYLAGLIYGKSYVVGSSFRLIKASLAKQILIHARNFSFIDEFIIWYTSNQASVMVNCSDSKRGGSRYSVSKIFSMFVGLVLISSTIPLKIIKIFGGLLTVINFIIGLYYIYQKYMYKISVNGYTSIIVSVLFSTGIIIFILSIIAEYISKLLQASYSQPAFNEEIIL